MKPKTFRRIGVLLILAALISVLGFRWGPELWWQIRHEKRGFRHKGVGAGFIWVHRATNVSHAEMIWYEETGFLATEVLPRYPGRVATFYAPDGTITVQTRQTRAGETPELKREPPWWQGKSDQSEPSAPWILAGQTLDEWWNLSAEE